MGTPPNFFKDNPLLCSFSTIDVFFRTAVLWKLFDIRFSYKHCNFSHVCLLIKMVWKTVTIKVYCKGLHTMQGEKGNVNCFSK